MSVRAGDWVFCIKHHEMYLFFTLCFAAWLVCCVLLLQPFLGFVLWCGTCKGEEELLVLH